MPCKDTTSLVTIWLDHNERLMDYDFSKITCSKEIGGHMGYKQYCIGRGIKEITQIEFNEVLQAIPNKTSEDQFLLYLEWDALKSALDQYCGWSDTSDPDRYQVESIEHDEKGIVIRQVIRPAKEMPAIVSCLVRSRSGETDQSSG